jgi:hypothetical protein
MKVVPSSSATVVKFNDAVEFARGSSMNTTWRASYWCLATKPTEGDPEVVDS